ncbi:MAG: hypothetical protein NTV72_03905 [Candidatus Taylorbacteria bacterium]|nr:hypothetical protein [Candidatus Taylorbacteria bacterium]
MNESAAKLYGKNFDKLEPWQQRVIEDLLYASLKSTDIKFVKLQQGQGGGDGKKNKKGGGGGDATPIVELNVT